METALNGLSSTVKHSATKEAIQAAKESLKSFKENKDVAPFHVRDKLLSAFELALDNGNEKHSYFAVDGIQILLRDQSFHDINTEEVKNSLTSQILNTLTGIDEYKGQVQCKCITLLVEMVCSNELKVSLTDVEECVQIYKRLYGKSEEERVRVACRAATTQSLTAYFSNRYAACDATQDSIAVYLDVCKFIEELCAEVEQMSSSHEQCLISLDSICALLTTSNLKILQHQPFVNLLWEKLCPLIILLLGIPTGSAAGLLKSGTERSTKSSDEEIIGEGSVDFALAPAILANPHTWRALYQIVEQLIRLMIHDNSLTSSLEALFHKAFLYPRVDQRGEALKLIKKLLGDPAKLSKIAKHPKSLTSLWRMLIQCVGECATPQLELAIDAVRCVVSILDGLKQFATHRFFTDEERDAIEKILGEQKKELEEKNPENQSSTIIEEEGEAEVFEQDEMCQKLKRLEQKFNFSQGNSAEISAKISTSSRRSSELDESSERNTAKKFVESLWENLDDFSSLKSTLAVDETILQFASNFYNNFCLVHADAYKNRCKIQQEFLNTDAIYLTTYAALTFLNSSKSSPLKIEDFKKIALGSGCVIHVANGWIEKVYDNLNVNHESHDFSTTLRDVINDFCENEKKGLLSDVEKLKKITQGALGTLGSVEEETLAFHLTDLAWPNFIEVLSIFLSAKSRSLKKEREKIQEAISLSICGMRGLVSLAQVLGRGLETRCGWVFEQLVETSCCLEDLREDAVAEEGESARKEKIRISREHLLAMQLVLDESRIAIHSPTCWKHIVRCTEYVWELEKYIYGALCYEKPSRLKFLRRKTEEESPSENTQDPQKSEDFSIENAIGEEKFNTNLSVHSINRAIAVLIAKVDRFYSQVCRELCLPALRELCRAIVSASETRIFYSQLSHVHLTAPVMLLTRISDIISSLSHRPLIHQMFIYPIVSSHFVQVCQSGEAETARISASALAEVAARLLVSETPGLCFNQTLVLPFQTATCSDGCSDETKEQLLCSLSQLVLSQADKIGSGWKPLFGSLKAVINASGDEKVHWCSIDVISSYLKIDTPNVLSSSILECIPCVINLLQNPADQKPEITQSSLRLLPSLYSLILFLYTTPHVPNYHLLHRSDLRSKCLEEVECAENLLEIVVKHGKLPWEGGKQTYEIASVELFLSFLEKLCGTLLTSNLETQKNLLDMIGRLLIDISTKPLGFESGAVGISAVILPYVQKWIRRNDVENDVKILKQVIGTVTQIVIDFLSSSQSQDATWKNRLIRDISALFVECVRFEKTCADFEEEQWRIYSGFLAEASHLSLRHIRLLNSYFVRGSHDENGDIGSVTAFHPANLQFQQFLMAVQVFSSKRGLEAQKDNELEIGSGIPLLMLSHGPETHRIEISLIVSSLLTHCLFIQLIAAILLEDLEELGLFLANLIKSMSLLKLGKHAEISEEIVKNARFLREVELEISSRRSLASREFGATEYHLIPVLEHDLEEGEIGYANGYRLVSKDFVEETVTEYEKHRERLKPDPRKNPFFNNPAETSEDPPVSAEKDQDFDEVRLAAYRDICLIPLRRILDSEKLDNLEIMKPAFQAVLESSPDLSVRQLTGRYIDLIFRRRTN
ncbi:unnamed protein product [Caenorhabditis angaria]|uniref:SEC7 domain-containing protein n=1 Tax=Caenorhabditis angaria TaxID=860376 RepID=A0A9P1I670_9PELO|nr:unnamed protein product [Caenorhabditis angaria]